MKKVILAVLIAICFGSKVFAFNGYTAFNNVIFNGKYFLADGISGYQPQPIIMNSVDGKNWNQSIISNSESNVYSDMALGLACSPTLCIATLDYGTNVLISYDKGLTWEYQNTGYQNNLFSSIVYANNMFTVAINNNIINSTDGKHWYLANIPNYGSYNPFKTIVYGNNMYVVLSNYGPPSTMLISYNGTDWEVLDTSNVPFISNNQINNIIYGGNSFYITTSKYIGILKSADFKTYSQMDSTFSIPCLEIHNNIMFGYISTNIFQPNVTSLSYDYGINWESQNTNTTVPAVILNNYAYGKGIYVSINGISQPKYSYDAINWVQSNW